MGRAMTRAKFTIEAEIVAAFKARRAKKKISMASAVQGFMTGDKIAKGHKPDYTTRAQRRKAVAAIISSLSEILELEEDYCDKIPEQFEQRAEAAREACEKLGEAIESLGGAF
jgi:hypothetical protein